MVHERGELPHCYTYELTWSVLGELVEMLTMGESVSKVRNEAGLVTEADEIEGDDSASTEIRIYPLHLLISYSLVSPQCDGVDVVNGEAFVRRLVVPLLGASVRVVAMRLHGNHSTNVNRPLQSESKIKEFQSTL